MRLSLPSLSIPRRPDSAIYLPLTPWAATPAKSFTEYSSSLLRRKGTFFILFAPAVALLFLVVRFYVGDWDDYDLDYDTLVSLHTSYMPFQVDSQNQTRSLPLSSSTLSPQPPSPTVVPSAIYSQGVTYPIFQVFPEDAPPPPALRPHSDPLPAECIDAHFTHGAPCFAPGSPKFDFVWTWVNGSDVLEQSAKKAAMHSYSSTDPWRPSSTGTPDRMFRCVFYARLEWAWSSQPVCSDHDELRHSFRSVLAAFRQHVSRILLLTSDFPVPPPNITLSASWRLSQLPQWLDLAKQTRSGWSDGDVSLDIIHHAEIFQPYYGTNFNR